MLGRMDKQSGNAVESVRKNKENATVGRICGKESFQAWNERMRGEQFIQTVATTTRLAREINAIHPVRYFRI